MVKTVHSFVRTLDFHILGDLVQFFYYQDTCNPATEVSKKKKMTESVIFQLNLLTENF